MINPEALPLEDAVADIIGKAQKGLRVSDAALAERAGVDATALRAIKNEDYANVEAIEKLGFALNLDAPSLTALAHKDWHPQTLALPNGLAMFTTLCGDMTVNAFLIWDSTTREAASFDTGGDAQPILDFIEANNLKLTHIFITHTHYDHLMDLERLQAAWPDALSYGSAIENPLNLKPLSAEDGVVVGKNLRIRVLGTHGHTPGGLSYFITGLAQPVVVVGDALFAASMGGAPMAYGEARANNLNHLLRLPEETIVCPGHGPRSTIGEERRHNPFFPECKPVRSMV